MSGKLPHPYQPLLFRLLHGLTGFSVIMAILTAFWTYDTYDGRWGRLALPEFPEIEGIHGTFGLYALLIFPVFVVYAVRRGAQRLIQPNWVTRLSRVGRPAWWYTLHQITNTLTILALTFALFSGKMMDETWLPQGELDHFWYYAHLVSWLVMVGCIALHLLMSAKVGGIPLLLSMLNWRFRAQDNPSHWRGQILNWLHHFQVSAIGKWFQSLSGIRILEAFVLGSIAAAWVISLLKESIA